MEVRTGGTKTTEVVQLSADPLGDGISKVELLDRMGSDLEVVNAARESLDKQSDWAEEIQDGERRRLLKMSDQNLIRHLATSQPMHWTPFGHPQLQFRIKMPLFVAREWFRHTVGTVRNEVSRRYVQTDPEFYEPTVWRMRADGVKQGSGEDFHPMISESLWRMTSRSDEEALELYRKMVDEFEVAPEMARVNLKVNMYTEFWETSSLAFYARVASLRISPLAQKEARLYAEAIDAIINATPELRWSWRWLRIAAEKPRKMEEAIKELLSEAARGIRKSGAADDEGTLISMSTLKKLEDIVRGER